MINNGVNQKLTIVCKSRNLEKESLGREKWLKAAWKILEHGIREILNKPNDHDIDLEGLYSRTHDMVILKEGEKLYMGLVTIMTSHVKEISKSIEEATQGDFFLEELNRKWNDYKEAILGVREVLLYMDRVYVIHNNKTRIHDLGMNLWRDNVVNSTQIIQSQLKKTLVELVHGECIGEVINRDLTENMLMMLKDLGDSVYETLFEIPFIEVSAEFYRGEFQKLSEYCDCGDYLWKAENHLIKGLIRVSHYLDSGNQKIYNAMYKEIIENHMLRLIHIENSWLVTLFLDDRYDDLRNLYQIFSTYPNGLLTIQKVVNLYVRNTGEKFVKDPKRLKDPMIFVQELLDMKDKYDTILNLAFNNDEAFNRVLDSSFEYIINLNHNLPEFLSLFLDVKLRKGFEGNSEEIILDKVVMFIKLLHDKDLFHNYYKKHLAKRLLFGKTISEDIETSLAVKLKRVCGYKFALLEIMVMDMKTSKEILQGFYRSHAELGDDPKLSFQVLTTGSWPLSRTTHSSCNLPVEVSALHEKYKSYYLGINAGKKLSLQPNMGNAEIIATFGNGRKHELHVSTYQMCVLMLFNDIDQLSFKEIENATKINSLDLIKCLYSMVFANGKNIIKKEPMNGNISEGDVFFVNDMFKSKFYKIKLETVATQRESEHEKLQTRKNVEEDRRPQIEATIVRIMKFKKQLDHKNIIAEVTKELKSLFLPNPTEIKKRIESLIERDYLERDTIDSNLYRYLS